MFSLFSFIFAALFIGFVVVALMGHILLVEALVRPFLGRPALRRVPARRGQLNPAG